MPLQIVRPLFSSFPMYKQRLGFLLQRRTGKMSYRKRSNCSEFPVFSESHLADVNELSLYRDMRDSCVYQPKPAPGGFLTQKIVGVFTFVNANKLVDMRYLPELALKLYNDNKLKSFKLVKVLKINRFGAGYYGLTFEAQEAGSEPRVFRGIVHGIGPEALFCEVKHHDDGITLLPHDDDYLTSERIFKSEDRPPCKSKNDIGDGATDSGVDQLLIDVAWGKFETRNCLQNTLECFVL
ncbi:uncharacterized protein [Henckelia pumila]|uniref:uncharacterized protein n=1 Tax=Henckelia pumila TaxID=405737 RepID=UPI003C6DB8BA